jgi:deazaflavin-dependent oxidoreductase (nitroreductase family)
MGIRQAAINCIRLINKYAVNRVTLKMAGGVHSPFSIVRHTGRRTGRAYATPVIAEPLGDGLVIAFTYGPEVDWYRNILAGGSCAVRRKGGEYDLANPELIDGKAALPAFPIALRTILRMVGTSQFLKLEFRKGHEAAGGDKDDPNGDRRGF